MPDLQIANIEDIKRALPLGKLSVLEEIAKRLDEWAYLFKDLWTPAEGNGRRRPCAGTPTKERFHQERSGSS